MAQSSEIAQKRTAFEVYQEEGSAPIVEQLIVLGEQLQRGQALPPVEGLVYDPQTEKTSLFNFGNISGVAIISFVNELGTPDCKTQTGNAERIAQEHPEFTVYTVSKQTPQELAEKAKAEGITHKLLFLDIVRQYDLVSH